MVYAIQYDFFEENDDISLLKKEIELLKKECSNVRKGLFSRQNDMMKIILNQQNEIDSLKHRK